jgi:hypothetical protein
MDWWKHSIAITVKKSTLLKAVCRLSAYPNVILHRNRNISPKISYRSQKALNSQRNPEQKYLSSNYITEP